MAENSSNALAAHYQDVVRPALQERFGYQSSMQVPKLERAVVNVGLGQAVQNPKLVDGVVDEVARLSGQRPLVTKARRSISNFKLREGMPIGVAVTLRRQRMYEFMQRLIHVALPRVRDFRGLSGKGFDGRGNYTLGLREQIIFPEIDLDKVELTHGLSVTMVTTAENDEQGLALLTELGMPFRSKDERA